VKTASINKNTEDAEVSAANTETPTNKGSRGLSGPAEAVGHAVGLMMASPLHRHVFLSDLEWLLLPPIMMGQFRIFRKDGLPAAFASWAFVNEEVEARLEGGGRLKPAEWRSGESMWLIDFVAPMGGEEAALKELCESVAKGRPLKTLRPSEDGKRSMVVEV